MTAGTVKFGDLLVKLNLISQADLEDALHVAPQFGLPLGRTLVLSGRLSEQELQVAIELQSLVNRHHYPLESARKIVALVRSGISPAVALKGVRTEESREKNTLGQLLLEAGLITQVQLDEAQKSSYQSGMRLGRILVLHNIIDSAQLNKALELQTMVREQRMAHEQAVQNLTGLALKKGKSPDGAAPPVAPRRQVRFSEFLVSSGLATETEMLNALEISLNRKLSLGETIVELGLVSKQVFDKAVDLYNKVCMGQMALNDATDQVHRTVFGNPLHDQGNKTPVLGELLKLTGLVTDNDIKEAISLSNKYPSVIGKMLVLSGCIDEAILIASLRCQFLMKHGYLRVEDGVAALQYCHMNKISFDDALEEMGLRKGQHPLRVE